MGTRATVETLLVNRRKALLTFVGLSTAVAGSNTDLADSIGYAVRMLGGSVADPLVPTDAEIDTAVGLESLDAVLDVAELRICMTIKGNLDTVDIISGPFAEKYSQLAAQLDKDIKRMLDTVEQYGLTSTSVEAGTIRLNIASRSNEAPLLDDSGTLVNP